MALKSLNGIIGDKPVFVMQWPATTALENLSEALGLMGPTLSFYIDGTYQFGDTVKVLHGCDHKQLTALLKKFVIAARVDGREVPDQLFNQEYSGELHRVFETFSLVCQVNYRDFFERGAPPPPPAPPETPAEPQPELLPESMIP